MAGQIKQQKSQPTAEPTKPASSGSWMRPDGGVTSEAVSLDGVETARPQPPRLPANHPWLWAVHPDRWGVTGGKVLPVLRRISTRPGIEMNDVGEPRQAALSASKEGWHVIGHKLGPSGSYLRRVPVAFDRNGDAVGWHHLSAFEQSFAGSPLIKCDTKALGAWIWSLVESGQIPGPSLHGLEKEKRRLEAASLKAGTRAKSSSAAEAKAKSVADAVEVISALINRMNAAVELTAVEADAVELD